MERTISRTGKSSLWQRYLESLKHKADTASLSRKTRRRDHRRAIQRRPEVLEQRTLLSATPGVLDISELDGSNGFTIPGTSYGDAAWTDDGSIGSIELLGSSGDDVLDASSFSTGPVTLSGGAGDDALLGGSFDDRLTGDDGNDTLVGGAGNDFAHGGERHDIVRGQSGNALSPRYRDMSETWASVGYRPLKLNPDAWRSSLVLTP